MLAMPVRVDFLVDCPGKSPFALDAWSYFENSCRWLWEAYLSAKLIENDSLFVDAIALLAVGFAL